MNSNRTFISTMRFAASASLSSLGDKYPSFYTYFQKSTTDDYSEFFVSACVAVALIKEEKFKDERKIIEKEITNTDLQELVDNLRSFIELESRMKKFTYEILIGYWILLYMSKGHVNNEDIDTLARSITNIINGVYSRVGKHSTWLNI